MPYPHTTPAPVFTFLPPVAYPSDPYITITDRTGVVPATCPPTVCYCLPLPDSHTPDACWGHCQWTFPMPIPIHAPHPFLPTLTLQFCLYASLLSPYHHDQCPSTLLQPATATYECPNPPIAHYSGVPHYLPFCCLWLGPITGPGYCLIAIPITYPYLCLPGTTHLPAAHSTVP